MYNILKRLQVRRTAVTITYYYNIIMYNILKYNNDINCFLKLQKCQMKIFPTRHKK